MASPSSLTVGKGKELEKKKEEEKKDERRKREYKDMHVKLDREFIDYLKNLKDWPEMEPPIEKTEQTLTDQEQVEEMSRRTFDFDYVLKNHLLDEEIVWEDDGWGLQQHINGIPGSHATEAENN